VMVGSQSISPLFWSLRWGRWRDKRDGSQGADWMDDFYGNMMREREIYIYIYIFKYIYIWWIVLMYYNMYIYIVNYS
jgi:hypothetical protein